MCSFLVSGAQVMDHFSELGLKFENEAEVCNMVREVLRLCCLQCSLHFSDSLSILVTLVTSPHKCCLHIIYICMLYGHCCSFLSLSWYMSMDAILMLLVQNKRLKEEW